MANEQLLFTIGANDKASSALSKIKKNLSYLDKEYKTAKGSSKDFENTQEGLGKKIEYLSSSPIIFEES